MGVEVAGSDVPKVNGEVNGKLHEQGNEKIDFGDVITFGSHGVDEPESKGEATDVSAGNFPKDAVDEWPEAAQTHSFWFVKCRPLEDPSLKAKIDQADKEIQKKKQQIDLLYEDLNAKKAQKYELINELKAFNEESSQYRAFINEKREELKPLKTALGSLRGGGGGERGYGGICSSEEELNQTIRSLEYRMQHESLTLKEEKQLVKEIKELAATRPKVIAHSAERAKIQDSMGQKEAIQDQVNLLGTDLGGVLKQQAAVKVKKDRLNTQLDALKVQITALENEISNAKDKKNAAYGIMQELKNKREVGNALHYESRSILNNAKQIAIKKDVKALEELNKSEVEKFMSQWNSSKAFRDDYEKRLLPSLDYRQLSRDGRMRNFDEKPLMKAESPSEPDAVSQATLKQPKEVAKNTSKAEDMPAAGKTEKESKKGSKDSKIAPVPAPEEEEIFVVGKPKKDVSTDNIDSAKLKELKREEEMEKQRQAMERKKKQQEKNAAKAALRAQKEAEKKLKEREKKQRKKGGATLQAAEEEEPAEKSDADEPEKTEEVEEEAVVAPTPSKAKVGNVLKHRKFVKPRGTLPKAILKKKKSDKYWLWGYIAAAVLGVLLLLVLGYKYLL